MTTLSILVRVCILVSRFFHIGSNWTYDLIDHMMEDLNAIIALTLITCVLGPYNCKLHIGMKISSITFSLESES